MAVATTTLLLAGAAVTTGAAVAKSISGSKMASEAKDAINDFERQDIENAYAKLAPSTAGAELQAENLMRTTATLSEQAGETGARGTVGMGGEILKMETQASREIAAQLDEQKATLDKLAASGEMQTQAIREQRENQELAALGQMYQTGRQDMWSGITEASKGLSNVLGMAGGGGGGGGPMFPAGTQASNQFMPELSQSNFINQFNPETLK